MPPRRRSEVVKTGLIFGGAAVYLCLVGVVETFRARWIVEGVIALGQAMVLATAVVAGYRQARSTAAGGPLAVCGGGALSGLIVGAFLTALLLAGTAVDLRVMFLNASPGLYALLAFGGRPADGGELLLLASAASGLLGALLFLVPPRPRGVFLAGLAAVLFLSMFQDLLQLLLQGRGAPAAIRALLFGLGGPSVTGAVLVCVVTWLAFSAWALRGDAVRARIGALPPSGRRGLRLAAVTGGLVGLLLIPVAGGPFVAQVMVTVGLYTLMGLGLNLEVGFAGLLDLGFVAFFAVGAYTVGLVTSLSEHGLLHLSFWAAVPIAVATSLVAGVIFGIPILRVRGDYLAIATLGLGEIVRLLVLSDALRPWLGGSFGILSIPRPQLAGFVLGGPKQLYYLTLVSSAVAAYVAWRLQDSRLGRAWMAIREDEDVAQAIGIDLVATKLLAYGLGATFAGVGGAIFAVMLGSVFPHSFQLLISINVLALIIVGGMGSLWGVVVGAVALVGLPELLREFGEFRFLVYGIVLVAMMLYRPEGLVPAAAQQRELHTDTSPEAGPGGIAVAADLGGLPAHGGHVAGASGRPGGRRRGWDS